MDSGTPSEPQRFVRIDPRDFITPPFSSCPKCGRETFGVLSIFPRHYVRRCRECWHTARTDLPKLSKRVVYVDQLGISEMMKALNPRTKAHQGGRVDPRWREVFRRLDRLVKLQLIVCPESEFHRRESTVAPFDDALKRMIGLLSGGVTFRDEAWIESLQIQDHCQNWINGRPDAAVDLSVERVTIGNLNGWTDRFILSANLGSSDEWLETLREQRGLIYEQFAEIFEGWRTNPRSFDEWFAAEVAGYGRGVVRIYCEHLARVASIAAGLEALSLEVVFPPPALSIIGAIRRLLSDAGVLESGLWTRIGEYLTSDSLRLVPFLKIRAMLYAALARKAAAGRRRPPDRGFASDVTMVSVLLPYCDAMVLDNEVAGYLGEQPLATELNYGTRSFSRNSLDEMIEYLEGIEASMPTSHVEKVSEVYGQGWAEPFESVYLLED